MNPAELAAVVLPFFLALGGLALRMAIHFGRDEERFSDTNRRLLRLERHAGYENPERATYGRRKPWRRARA